MTNRSPPPVLSAYGAALSGVSSPARVSRAFANRTVLSLHPPDSRLDTLRRHEPLKTLEAFGAPPADPMR